MHRALRIASYGIHRSPPRLLGSPVASWPRSAFAHSRGQRICTRLSTTDSTSVAKEKVLKDNTSAPENKLSSVPPLPPPPPSEKGTPPIINTRDIEEYIQPLYSRGWGLSPILPNGNGIAVLRRRFDFASEKALKTFLAGLKEYEETKQHHAKVNVIGDQEHAVVISTWTHVALGSDAEVQDKTFKTQGVTARDICLAYALEGLFESALAASGREYVPRLRPEADRPKTIEELEGYS